MQLAGGLYVIRQIYPQPPTFASLAWPKMAWAARQRAKRRALRDGAVAGEP